MNVFAIFTNVLAIILRLAIIATNQLLPFLLLLLLTLRVSNQWFPSLHCPSLLDPLSPFPQLTFTISSSLSITSGMSPSSWLMDFACCNHMTPHSSLFSQLELAPHPLNIRTANGSTMFSHKIGSIWTSNLSVSRVFNVLNLSYYLFSVRKLVEFGYCITFDYSRCIVQDPRMGQELGACPRVDRMFPNDNLRLPPVAPVSVAVVAVAVSTIPSLALWHARLRHVSSSWVQHMASRGLLGSMSTKNFDCVSCQRGK